jgi:hypothetical protein
MQSDINTDITAITIQLNELRSKFDQGMREGQQFSDLKETYLQIKELECYLKALDWDPEKETISHHVPISYAWM